MDAFDALAVAAAGAAAAAVLATFSHGLLHPGELVRSARAKKGEESDAFRSLNEISDYALQTLTTEWEIIAKEAGPHDSGRLKALRASTEQDLVAVERGLKELDKVATAAYGASARFIRLHRQLKGSVKTLQELRSGVGQPVRDEAEGFARELRLLHTRLWELMGFERRFGSHLRRYLRSGKSPHS